MSTNLPVFLHPCFCVGDFNCRYFDWVYDDNSPDGEFLAGWASINSLALLHNAKNAASFYSGHLNTDSNSDLAFASRHSRPPDRPSHCLVISHSHTHRSLHSHCQACLLSDGTFRRLNGVTTLL